VKLRNRSKPHRQWGYADFFDNRHKMKALELAEITKDDIIVDLGCGDSSFLIFAVKNFGVKAVGFENMPQRIGQARKKIRMEHLENKITIKRDFYKEKWNEATIIFDMMPEEKDDLNKIYFNIKAGTKLIKHDLPLIGFVPDKVDIPFYRMTFPLKKAKSKTDWISSVLQRKKVKEDDIWNELYYYGLEKTYSKWEIKLFNNILEKRISK